MVPDFPTNESHMPTKAKALRIEKWTSPVIIDARQDEKETGAGRAALLESAQPENDGPLVLLDHLDAVAEREGQRHEDQKDGDG